MVPSRHTIPCVSAECIHKIQNPNVGRGYWQNLQKLVSDTGGGGGRMPPIANHVCSLLHEVKPSYFRIFMFPICMISIFLFYLYVPQSVPCGLFLFSVALLVWPGGRAKTWKLQLGWRCLGTCGSGAPAPSRLPQKGHPLCMSQQ